MSQPPSQLWNRFFDFLLKRIMLVLTLLFCAAMGMALSNMSWLSSNLIEAQAVQNAALYIQSFDQAIDLYSVAAADRARNVEGIEVTHAYLSQPGGIPLPSTFAIELGDRVSNLDGELTVRFFSDYPFPWREGTGGPQDKFEQDALDFLRRDPRRSFSRLETVDGKSMMRYGEASIMSQSCVACHNTHPNSPKKDWAVGDVAGVWEVSQPLDSLMSKVSNHLRGTLFVLGGMSILGVSGLTLVIGKLRQTARELEGRVKERTADLAQANGDLEKRNQLIQQVFGRYLSNEIVTNLLSTPEGLKLGGERRKITILTSDLRGFTVLSERLPPEEVINILNLYLERMADVIDQYQGTIDEFMGDGILVLFGAPTPREDDALRSIVCACAMQLAMGAVNERMKRMGLPLLEMGIGINTGEVVVGNIGSEKRTKYGIVGSQVNLTYRIESYTQGGQILISEETLREAGGNVKIIGKRQVKPKGVKAPITIYEVYGVSGIYNIYLPREEELFFPIPAPLPLQYTYLDGKHISDVYLKGYLVKLSTKGAEIRPASPSNGNLPPELANLKLNLLQSNQFVEASEDIYAKVVKHQVEQGSFCIHFTSLPPKVQIQLGRLYKSIAHYGEGE
ncbi:adenylate/guanylate cyclase domain-containing protein [filamentous cyanobacterium CCP2]|nr:adenylate/guanylate cyclase domain-containing protein [filamentous cyanobacterium CCP2]